MYVLVKSHQCPKIDVIQAAKWYWSKHLKFSNVDIPTHAHNNPKEPLDFKTLQAEIYPICGNIKSIPDMLNKNLMIIHYTKYLHHHQVD